MKLINKTETTLIFNDINLVLVYDKDGKGVDVEDYDIKNSPTLKHYIDRGLVEVNKPDEDNVVYRSIKNRQEVVDRQLKEPTKIKKNSEQSESSNSDIILGGETKVISSRVYRVPETSSIDKFRNTGKMDISYCGPCFSGDTIVIITDGVKFIKDVEINDRVLTHNGNWKSVTGKHIKFYNSSMLSIKPNLFNGISINCTPNHRFYIKNIEEIKWKKARSISSEDSFIIPPISFESEKKFILLSDYVKIDFDELQDGFCSVIKLTDGFLNIIWEYINSGEIIGDSEVSFKINKYFFFEFMSLMREIFGVSSVKYVEYEKYFKYTCHSFSLVKFFEYFCGSEFKKIPSFIFKKNISKRFLKLILFEKEANKKGTIVIYSRHPLIAWGIRLLLLESSIVSSIQYIPSRKNYCVSFSLKKFFKTLKDNNLVDESFKWEDTTVKNRPATYDFTDNGIYVPFYDMKPGEYSEYVYNLDVEDDNSYTAGFCSVHNCYDAGGYAKMNRNYMFGLSKKDDVNLKLDLPKDLSIRKQVEEELVNKLDELRKNKVGEDVVKIYGSTATGPMTGRYNILYTMMETEKVHPQYIEKCNMANELWLPTDWCIEKFKESGARSKIYKMPIGVDFENYVEGKPPVTFGGKENGFIFLTVFGWSLRKGYDILLQSYYEEFSKNDDVTLVICSRFAGKTDKTSKQVIKDNIKTIEQSVKKLNKPKPPLLIADVIPEKMMGSLYNSAHAYICISRGEGFGMPFCEASLCGLPVIASNYSGQKDFLNYDNSFLVEPEGCQVNPGAEWVSYYYTDMPMAYFGRDSIDQTRAHMRYVYENYALAKDRNRKLQKFIKENYDWNKCVNRMYDRLKIIYSEIKHRGEK